MVVISAVFIALLIVGTFAFVLRPLFTPDSSRPGREKGGVPLSSGAMVDELIARRDALYAALKDAEFDRETGKLTDEDYQIVRARYMAEAAQVLRQLDQLTPEAEAALDAEIEQAVAGMRAGSSDSTLSPDLEAAVEAEVAALVKHAASSAKRGLACPDCGRSYQAGDRFCAACGTSLKEIRE